MDAPCYTAILFFCFNAPSDKNPTIASLPYTDALPKSDGYLSFGFLLPALVHEYPETDRKKLRRRRLKDAEPKRQNGGKFNLELYILEIFL